MQIFVDIALCIALSRMYLSQIFELSVFILKTLHGQSNLMNSFTHLMFWPSDDAGENAGRGVVAGDSNFTQSRSIVYDYSTEIIVRVARHFRFLLTNTVLD